MIAFAARIVLRLLFRVRVRGNLGRHERLLIVANHQSFLDGALLGAFLPVKPVWVMHSSFARLWYVRLGMRPFPYLVVDAANPLAIKAVVRRLESGAPVMIFPEGRITVTGSLMKMYDGPAFAAARTGADIVPVHIEGAVHTWFSRMGHGFRKKLFPRITLTIGAPSRIPMPEARTARERRRLASEALRRVMERSAFEARSPNTLFTALLDAIRLYGRRRRMIEDIRFEPQSYGALLKASLALGRLAAKFTAEGEYAGVLMPNAAATVSLLFGLLAMRRVPAMLNFSSGRDAMQNACRMAGVKVVFTSRAFLDRARLHDTARRLEDVRLVYLEDLRPRFGWRDKLWLLGFALRFPRAAARPGLPVDPAVVLFTSGSEGRPKGVVLSHQAILANVAQLKAVVDFTSRDRMLNVLPLFHAFGLTAGVFLPLLEGAPAFLYPSPLHYRAVPEMAYDRDCTVMFATNTFLAQYAKFAHPYDLRRIRILGSGAERLTADVREAYFEKFGIRITEGYGATECAPVITMNTYMAHKSGSVGQVLPGIETRIVPVAGIEEGGVLHVRGPNLMLGYLRPDEPGRIEPPASECGPGWYDTGDLVTMDERGFLTIRGRRKRFAKVAGEMVSLEVAENIAAAAAPGAQHAAVAVEEPGRGDLIVLVSEEPGLRREQLARAARSLGLPELAVARKVIHLPKLPLLGNGKKDYVTLAAMAGEALSGEAERR